MIRPVNHYVLIDPIKPEDITQGGIVLPDTAKIQQPKGTLLAISAKVSDKAVPPIGSVVYYQPFAGALVTVAPPGKPAHTYLLLRPEDIMAVEEPAPTEVVQ